MLKQLLFIGAILAVIVGSFSISSKLGKIKSSNADSYASTTSSQISATSTIVLITSSGFSPKSVTVKRGSIVTFKNIDGEAHWPASDAHPSHTVYPEFDPKDDVLPGESWSFVFDKVGEWRFHDHENPLLRGTVTVVSGELQKETVEVKSSAEGKIKTISAECLKTSADFSCYEKYYENLAQEKGIVAAFADLKERYNGSAYVRSQCHPLTHVIGHVAVELYPEVSLAYTHGDSFCWSGYYHGVMEGIIGKVGKFAVVEKLDSICSGIPGKTTYSFDYYNCVHGLGHGLMALTFNELFDSLKICDNLQGLWEKQSCYGGVFMENVIVDNKNHFTKYLKPEEPLYPCNAVEDKYKSSCYMMQTSYMLKVTGSDFKKVFELCSSAENGYQNLCYQSLGRDASGRSLSNAEVTKVTCELGSGYEQQSNCIIGAVKDFISYYHSDAQAKHFCEILSPAQNQICLDTASSYYKSF